MTNHHVICFSPSFSLKGEIAWVNVLCPLCFVGVREADRRDAPLYMEWKVVRDMKSF